jgi:DNA-binding transcriptional regulator GbsR (MarR family)
MFLTILEERKRREVDPILETLRQCLEDQESDTAEGVYAAERMQDMLDLLEQVLTLYGHMRRLSPTSQRRVLQLGARLEKIVGDDQPARRARRR